jgi:hypothetical protein
MHSKLILPLLAAAATTAYRIAAFAAPSSNSSVQNATAATAALVGIFGPMAHDAADMADVQVEGEAEVELGGTVTAGAFLTSDAQGRAVALAPPGAGVTHFGIAKALEPGVIGDRIKVQITPMLLRGA